MTASVEDHVVLYAIRYCLGRRSIAALSDGPALVREHAAMLVKRGWHRSLLTDIANLLDDRPYWSPAVAALHAHMDPT